MVSRSLGNVLFVAATLHDHLFGVVAEDSIYTVKECTKWTQWYDRDNIGGNGDYELYHLESPIPCGEDNLPVDVECRSVLDQTDFDDFYFDPSLNAKCQSDGTLYDGFSCTNSDSATCTDFEVRFCCEETVKYQKCSEWSGWLDRDNPSGNGDYELYHLFDPSPCRDGVIPYGVKCQDIATGLDYSMYTFPSDIGSTGCEVDGIGSDGFFCNNGEGRCPDFRVNFCCDVIEIPAPTSYPTGAPTGAPSEFRCREWSEWYNRDYPTGTGDWEQYKLYSNPPCGKGVLPLDVECRSVNDDGSIGIDFDSYPFDPAIVTKYCEVTGDGTDGFVCINPESVTICPDFMVRFCCA